MHNFKNDKQRSVIEFSTDRMPTETDLLICWIEYCEAAQWEWDEQAPLEVDAMTRSPPLFSGDVLVAAYRKVFMEIIEREAPYACMLTVNFAHPYPDEFLLSSMNELIKRLNRAVFGRSAKRNHLQGICSVEVCRDGGVLDRCLHFHILIKPTARLTKENARRVFLPKVLKIVKELTDSKGRSISNRKVVRISPYTGIGSLPTYLTKEFEYRGIEAAGFIGDLSPKGIVGLSIPPNRKKRDLIRDTTG